ncbi:MAG TPA: CHAP domain-containing protein [Gemmataceae bacterium]|nr:CHAP domain-containing protein [Gemmataceae bacterium]
MMSQDHFVRFICLFCAGLGLLLAGGVNWTFRSARGYTRVLVCLVAMGCTLAGLRLLIPDPGLIARAGGLMVLGMTLCLLVGSGRFAALVSALLELARRPRVRWGVLAVAGVLITLGSLVAYEVEDQAALDRQLSELDELAAQTPTRDVAQIRATTDRGTPVVLKEPTDPRARDEMAGLEERYFQTREFRRHIIRQERADDRSNCHGWVFTGGRYWVTGNQVDLVLRENGYRPVAPPHPGDLIVYRNADEIAHSAIVRYVTDGLPVMVEGKWGCTGVYLHLVDQSCYGADYTYYRSRRHGHLLAGIDGPSPPAETATE